MIEAIFPTYTHFQVGMIYPWPEPCASRDRDVYPIHVGSQRPRHVSRHRILIVEPLSRVITSINHRPLSAAVTASLICVPAARAICNDLGNLEALTFIFPGDKQNVSTHKRFLQTESYHGYLSSHLRWGIEAERRENAERYNQTL